MSVNSLNKECNLHNFVIYDKFQLISKIVLQIYILYIMECDVFLSHYNIIEV